MLHRAIENEKGGGGFKGAQLKRNLRRGRVVI